MKVIRIIGLANGEPTLWDGTWLVSCDIRSSRMLMTTTIDPREAKTFPHAADAMEFWRRIDPERPLRPDGKPNRPLTAYTVSIEDIP